MKSSPGAVRTQNGPLMTLKADDDPRMSLQFHTITSLETVEGRHPQSKIEEVRFGSARPKRTFDLRSVLYFCISYIDRGTNDKGQGFIELLNK